jgi:diguanylate cyclase (GGDEF)-like protein/PAS domain S-box-containing protein
MASNGAAQRLKGHRRLGWLFGLVLLPGLLIGCGFLVTQLRQGEAQLERGALQTARALSQVFDGELAARAVRLETLALSPHLATGDLAAFHGQARAALGAAADTDAIVLLEGGRQLLNTRTEYGASLPPSGAGRLLERTLTSGKPTVSALYIGTQRPVPLIAVAVPLAAGRALVYGQPAAQLRRFLVRQDLPAGWEATLLDQHGRVIASSGTAPPGLPGGAEVLAGLARQSEGRIDSGSEAVPHILSYSQSSLSGWTVVLRVERGVLLGSLYRELAWAGAAIALTLLGGGAMAWQFNRRTLNALDQLRLAVEGACAGQKGVRATPQGPLEIATLARQFNRMQDSYEAAERRLQLAASVFSTTAEGIMLADAEYRILEVNRAFETMSGYARHELIGQSTRILQSGKQDRGYYERMWQALADHGHWQGQLWDRRRDGTLFAAHLAITRVCDPSGAVSHYIALFADITELRLRQDEIERQAHVDPLTQLPNRRLLADRMQQALARARRNGSQLAVCAMDLDGFKQVNDERGHDAGDQVLVTVAERLQSLVRANDTVARLGGDEFLLLLADLDNAGLAEEIAGRALQAVREPIALANGLSAHLSASIGIALYPGDAGSAEDLMRLSDRAMYAAKDGGRNQFRRACAA